MEQMEVKVKREKLDLLDQQDPPDLLVQPDLPGTKVKKEK